MSDGTGVDPIAASIALMEAQIAKLRGAIETLEGVRSLVGSTGVAGTPRNGAEASFGHDAFFGMSAADAAKKYLSAAKKTAPVKIIADALIAGGWKTAAKNIPENLRTILGRTPAFVLINGQFGLAEWYPGRKSPRRQGTADELASAGEEVAATLGDQEERTSTVPATPSEQ